MLKELVAVEVDELEAVVAEATTNSTGNILFSFLESCFLACLVLLQLP